MTWATLRAYKSLFGNQAVALLELDDFDKALDRLHEQDWPHLQKDR